MNKIFKKLIMFIVVVCTISTISFADVGRPANAKGTILGGNGSKGRPYQLIMGESVIDIYYGTSLADQYIYFEFTEGSVNAGNYLVEHNSDKKRIRLTLIGTDEGALRVTSSKGSSYLQAGGITYVPDHLKDTDVKIEGGTDEGNLKIQQPFYNIISNEQFNLNYMGETSLSISLGNGYLNNGLLSNISPYSTSYIFSKSNLKMKEAYSSIWDNIGATGGEASGIGAEIKKFFMSFVEVYGEVDIQDIDSEEINENANVRVVYKFEGTDAKTALSEKAGGLESLVSKIFVSIGDTFIKTVGLGGVVVGSESEEEYHEYYVTIDSLVFNEYPNTIVNFFGDTKYTNEKAQQIIEFWFDVFKAWAIIIYIVLLIYIGIKTVLVSGTSEQKKVKSMLEGWLQGLLLLFFLPFLFKYLIVINDALVDIIRVNSKYSIHAYYSFEHLYEQEQEDGEDSTTSVIEKLQEAKVFVAEQINEKQEKIKKEEESLERAKKLQEDLKKENETRDTQLVNSYIELSRNRITGLLNEGNYKMTSNGNEIDISELENELSALSINFYNKEENREKFLETESITNAITNNEDFENEVNKYSENLKFISNVDGTEHSVPKYFIYVFAVNIMQRDCYDIIYEAMEKNLEEREKSLKKSQNELRNIEIAIEKLENGDADITRIMRTNAGDTGRFFYVVIWIALIFEVILLLFLYYKRLFMLMVLIAIFPLVTVAYVYEKAKGGKAAILKNWMQEYIVNIFIQSIHAILYVTLVEAGYTVFLGNNDNWLIYFLAVISLIMIEPVFKHLLGMKSSTVVDLTKYGAAGLKVAGAGLAVASTVKNTFSDLEKIDKKSKNKEAATKKKQEKDDKRQKTIRQHRDNKINNDKNLTKEQKEKKLKEKHEKDEKADKRKEWLRKKNARRREHMRSLMMTGRIAANTGAAFGTIVGGLAAGGDLDDFITAASVANAITGTGGKEKLSKEAEEAEKNKETVESKVGNVSAENAGAQSANYSGPGYDDYAYGTGSGEGGSGDMSNIDIAANVKPSKVAARFAARLQEEKIYVNKKYNETEEEE